MTNKSNPIKDIEPRGTVKLIKEFHQAAFKLADELAKSREKNYAILGQ